MFVRREKNKSGVNNKRENPAVISAAYQVNRDSEVEALASFLKFHGYLKGDNDARNAQVDKIKGYPIVKINDKGHIILSEVLLEKGKTDPVAGKLFINMIDDLLLNKKTEK